MSKEGLRLVTLALRGLTPKGRFVAEGLAAGPVGIRLAWWRGAGQVVVRGEWWSVQETEGSLDREQVIQQTGVGLVQQWGA